jgi:tRNA (guanine9-N1)-methyltransferase
MSDIEERPSKIRKVEPSEDLRDRNQNRSASLEKEESEEINGLPEREDGENGTPQADAQGETAEKPALSKSQLKKIRKREQWEAGKEYRKIKRREKHKEKQARKAAQRAAAEEKIANGEAEASEVLPTTEKKPRPRRPIQVPVSLIMDCDFDELMTEKELISLGAQLTRCYSDNKTTPYRSHMAITSWNGKLRTRFETVLTNNHLSWKGMRFFEEDFIAAAKELDGIMRGPEGGKLAGALSEGSEDLSESKSEEHSTEKGAESQGPTPKEPSTVKSESVEQPAAPSSLKSEVEEPTTAETTSPESTQPKQEPSIVYLTSDSPHTLERLSPNTSYIIGGIVDKNRHKGICYKRACERGIATAKLPIGEYMTMQSRSVLAVNHVVEIMLKWLETGDWGEAFLSVIPKRKEAKLKVKKEGSAVDSKATTEERDSGDEEEDGISPENREEVQ